MHAAIKLTLEPIDLSLAEEHECPGIVQGELCLALIEDEFVLGRFYREWYGWNFECDRGALGIQFNAPGWCYSSWQALWRITGADDLVHSRRGVEQSGSSPGP